MAICAEMFMCFVVVVDMSCVLSMVLLFTMT